MSVIKYILIFWIATYLWCIAKSVHTAFSIKKLLETLAGYLNSSSINSSNFPYVLNKAKDFLEKQNEVLMLVPAINRHISGWCEMGYGKSDETNYAAAVRAYNELLMKQNYVIDEIAQSFNPLRALKILFQAPSLLAKYIGINPKNAFSKILNLITWIAVYLFGAYQSEIKMLLNSIFH